MTSLILLVVCNDPAFAADATTPQKKAIVEEFYSAVIGGNANAAPSHLSDGDT